ncbi:MAG: 1-acyl-sn-glycerol-3-phosphate acyltransferase [Bacteroidetes bacterium]|nr:1-acyl-sn-glycerol-3-phosphate acyltransferase [Bacteroidota bacterium]MCL5266472.1 1-acyl-sn-glycerol-3-phosphate acyltransferase [Bacteroidota bacterium]
MTRFILGATAAAIMTIVFAVLYLISFPFDSRNRVFSFIAYYWSRAVFMATGVKVRTVGLEKIDLSKPYVYVSNHASLFDIIAVVVGISRHIRFVAKKEIMRVPIFGLAVSRANIMVDRKSGLDGARSLENAARRISRGDSFILFAEGTRTRDGKLQPFKRGAFSLAIEAGVPVVPLTILGSYDIMRKGSLTVHGGTISIVVDPAIDVSEYRGRQGAFALMRRVHDIIEKNYITVKTVGIQPSAISADC